MPLLFNGQPPVNPHTPPPRAVRAHRKPESNNVILTLIGSDKSKGAKNFLRNHGKNSLWLHLFGSKLTYLIQIQQASRDASCLLWSIVNQATKKVDWIINRLSIPRAAYTQNDFRAGNVCKYRLHMSRWDQGFQSWWEGVTMLWTNSHKDVQCYSHKRSTKPVQYRALLDQSNIFILSARIKSMRNTTKTARGWHQG